MDTTFIEYEVERRDATITLSRAEQAHAQTKPTLEDFDEAFITGLPRVLAAAGVLLWPCDLVIAADNARKAKEMRFADHVMTAHDFERLGMVNEMMPLEGLRAETCALAEEITKEHPFALRQVAP